MLKDRLEKSKLIIITSLEGTLIRGHKRSFVDIALALDLIETNGIPLIFCSSKTRSELERYRHQLKVIDPFIIEDGGAVFIKKDYFKFHFNYDKSIDDYYVIELGVPCSAIRRILSKVEAETKLTIKGYGDMSVDEVAAITGLDTVSATLLKAREYQETLITDLDNKELSQLNKSVTIHGLKLERSGGFVKVIGPNDKRKAVSILINLYSQKFGDITTVGIGNSQNDRSMLSVVDLPFLLRNREGTWEDISIPNLQKSSGVGSIGWNRCIFDLLSQNRF